MQTHRLLLALSCAALLNGCTPTTTATTAEPVAPPLQAATAQPRPLTDQIEPLVLPAPPFQAFLAASNKVTKPLRLKVQSTKKNKITDTDAWFSKNGLSLSGCTYGIGANTKATCPSTVPRTYRNEIFLKAIETGTDSFIVYGRDGSKGHFLVVANANMESVEAVLDFSNFAYAPRIVDADRDFVYQEILWVDRVDNVIYVAHAHHTYAKSTYGMNAYITAIDLPTKQVLWRTQPLVSNANNFVIKDDVIISGYGFTAEPHYLTQIDRLTGKLLKKDDLRKSPEYILFKGNTLYVRTYDTDYRFSVKM